MHARFCGAWLIRRESMGRQSGHRSGEDSRAAMARYSWSMAKDQNKKRTAKTNKPKLTAKEKKLKKLVKKGK